MIDIEVDEDVFLPVYKKHITTDATIRLLYGGRDSGKSRHIAQTLIVNCLANKDFRGILVKKTFESIKDSQVQMLRDVIIEWNLQDYFTFTQKPLEIKCINGGRFLARGMDEPANIRSITNPTNAWVEEGDQLDQTDFITLLTSLRSNKGSVKMDISFNPECHGNYAEHWIYKDFFEDIDLLSFEAYKTYQIGSNEIKLHYMAIHSTYHDNPYCTPERQVFLESLKDFNPYYYQVFTLGLWGSSINKSPFFFAFDEARHVAADDLPYDSDFPLWVSFDFNRNPTVCITAQIINNEVRILDAIGFHNSGTDYLCKVLKEQYPRALFLVTGDYSGNTPSSIFKEQISNYTIIRSVLNIGQAQLKLTPNPRIERTRQICNLVLQNMNVLISPNRGKELIYDLKMTEIKPDGTLLKDTRKIRSQHFDYADCFRYLCYINFQHMLKEHDNVLK